VTVTERVTVAATQPAATVTVIRTIAPEPVAKTVTATPQAPLDVTDEFRVASRQAGMPADQQNQIEAAYLVGNTITLLTSMRAPFGGWDCRGTPPTIARVRLRLVTILYDNQTIFRTCPL